MSVLITTPLYKMSMCLCFCVKYKMLCVAPHNIFLHVCTTCLGLCIVVYRHDLLVMLFHFPFLFHPMSSPYQLFLFSHSLHPSLSPTLPPSSLFSILSTPAGHITQRNISLPIWLWTEVCFFPLPYSPSHPQGEVFAQRYAACVVRWDGRAHRCLVHMHTFL